MTFLAALLASTSDNSTLNDVEPGLLGFLVVAGIGIVLIFLLRSMNKQFRKLGPPPGEADSEDEDDGGEDDDAASGGGGAKAHGAKRR